MNEPVDTIPRSQEKKVTRSKQTARGEKWPEGKQRTLILVPDYHQAARSRKPSLWGPLTPALSLPRLPEVRDAVLREARPLVRHTASLLREELVKAQNLVHTAFEIDFLLGENFLFKRGCNRLSPGF